jgi:N-acetylmuramoyl-L-alanine amidase
VTEYAFNLRLARAIETALHAAGFDSTVLMITAQAPPVGLFRRAARANGLKADLFLAIHHDAVPDRLAETWQFAGHEQHFSDRFPGHSLFVSTDNANHAESLAFARLLGDALEARGLHYTRHYTEKLMGSRQRVLLDPKAGVYQYNQLIVLKETRMPAALLEAGSIVNRDEELLLATRDTRAPGDDRKRRGRGGRRILRGGRGEASAGGGGEEALVPRAPPSLGSSARCGFRPTKPVVSPLHNIRVLWLAPDRK